MTSRSSRRIWPMLLALACVFALFISANALQESEPELKAHADNHEEIEVVAAAAAAAIDDVQLVDHSTPTTDQLVGLRAKFANVERINGVYHLDKSSFDYIMGKTHTYTSDHQLTSSEMNPADARPAKTTRILIMFYAPWCSHCQKFKEKYQLVAEHLAPLNNVFVCMLDASAAAAKSIRIDYGIQGFPAFMMLEGVGAGTKLAEDTALEYVNLYKFKGSRSVQNLVEFVKSLKNAYRVSDEELKELRKGAAMKAEVLSLWQIALIIFGAAVTMLTLVFAFSSAFSGFANATIRPPVRDRKTE
mmetsp:Transcript_19688/g.33754  ORF Transcript_19688/g.33754 Transcript_19688/m.33754 type:complete len:303 (+) Transcript_19688:83-991(+)